MYAQILTKHNLFIKNNDHDASGDTKNSSQ